MREMFYSLLSSKKFVAAMVAVLVWVLGRVGWDVPAEDLAPVVGTLVAFVLAQGWADQGKEAVKETAKVASLEASVEYEDE